MFGFLKRKQKQDTEQRESLERQAEEGDTRALEDTPADEAVQTYAPEAQQGSDYTPDRLEREASRQALDGDLVAGESHSALDKTPAETQRDALSQALKRPEDEILEGEDAGASQASSDEIVRPAEQDVEEDRSGVEGQGWFARIRSGLGKTRANLTVGLADLFLGKKQIDDELIEDLETQLLMADVGIDATSEIIDNLSARVSRKELKEPEALYQALQEELVDLLAPVTKPLTLPAKGQGPFVILMVGVNGVGKTTTIGKLTQRFQAEGRSVMLAAGDTFRAAAVEQLKVWGERNNVPVVAQHTGADSASVIYDALAAAKARRVDVLIADTAGRLHNKSHLMEELKKVRRVMAKLDDAAPHEVMLVLDAGTGQNALSQATTFDEAIPITGITLTKLDGTAKGGMIFALAKQLKTPIRFIGVGESMDDLRPFVAGDFVDALFSRDDERA